MKGKEIIECIETYGAHIYLPLPVVIARGKGVWVYDTEGKKYLDMLSAYSALNQGHGHPAIIAALKEQAEKMTLTSRAFYNDQLAPFLKELAELCGMEMALPMNTGAEAMETAIKTARKWGYKVKGVEAEKAEIVVCHNNFHGRTTTIVGFSSEEAYREGFGPFTPGFKLIPYGDTNSLKKAITKNTVAFLVEPIQGEAGVIIPPEGFIREARQVCNENNVLLALDEIQTGFGRTGRLFCYEHDGARPDILIVGKALGGGVYPVSAVVASRKIFEVFRPGDHGSTFGGNPLAAAVARMAMKVLVQEGMVENSFKMGNYLIERLKAIKSNHVKEVRGKGLFIGVELKKEAGGARRFCEALMERGLLCKETHENVIRFAPPLVITKQEIDWALEKIKEVWCLA